MSRKAEVVLAWVLVIGSVVGMPVSMLTWAKHEPPTVLALSWIAQITAAYALLTSNRIHRDQQGEDDS